MGKSSPRRSLVHGTRSSLTNPEVKTRLGDLGVEARPGTPEQFGEFMAKESAKYAKLIKDANIRAE